MKTYFLTIAVVHSAALLAGKALKDQYAYLGAMAKHIGMDPGEMPDVDGIPEVPVKAQSFRFGIRCGDIIRNYYPKTMMKRQHTATQRSRDFSSPPFHPKDLPEKKQKLPKRSLNRHSGHSSNAARLRHTQTSPDLRTLTSGWNDFTGFRMNCT